MNPSVFAAFLDATNLKLDATDAELCALCDEALVAGHASVCVYPASVSLCADILFGSTVGVCTVIGFPHGRSRIAAKKKEIQKAADAGAAEVDIVMNYPALRAGERGFASEECFKLCSYAHEQELKAKVIVETCFLSSQQKLQALEICESANADFLVTSTGFGSGGATREDVALFAGQRKSADSIKIKATGGIRKLRDALALIDAGADRLGVSSSQSLMNEYMGEFDGRPAAAGDR